MQMTFSDPLALASRACLAVGAALLAVCAAPALAAPTDFRVLTDELTDVDEFGLELQASWARPARKVGGATVFQGLAELAYGLSKDWELSLQLPVSHASGTWRSTGANLELTYIAPHTDDEGLYWGGRVELGRSRPVGDEAAWSTELRPVLGWRDGAWHATLNPGFTANLSGHERSVDFEPSARLSYQLRPALAVGVEYFAEAGPLSHLLPSSKRQELGLLVLDGHVGKLDFNLGLGKGLTSASDSRVLKILLSVPMD